MKDLIVLVADKNMEFLIKGLFPRIPATEQVREFNFECLVHPYRDPGIYNNADDFLRSQSDKYACALVILDHAGCGREEKARQTIEEEVEDKVSRSGWQGRVCVIVIEPELENWVWVNETQVAQAISWEESTQIYDWLHANNWKEIKEAKPARPKEAFEATLRLSRTPRSSSIYRSISSQASYKKCQDPAFLKMLNQIKAWFRINQ